MAGTYHYKCTNNGGSWSATAFGEKAEDLPACEGGNLYDLNKAIYDVRVTPL